MERRAIVCYFFLPLLLVLGACSAPGHLTKSTDNARKYLLGSTFISRYDFIEIGDIRKFEEYYLSGNMLDQEIEMFYQSRNYRPAWINNGEFDKNARELLHAISQADREGLYPENYGLHQIYAGLHAFKTLKENSIYFKALGVRLDVMLTRAYLSYGNDLLSGSINPENIEIIWESHPRNKNLAPYLANALKVNDIPASLHKLKPMHAQYWLLREKLEYLQKHSSDHNWNVPEGFDILKVNDSAHQVLQLKKILTLTGDLTIEDSSYLKNPLFDDLLEIAVKKYQLRHDLKPDGRVGRNTLASMYLYPDYRIDQIKLNMERIRWLPSNLGNSFIFINLPDFSLDYYADDKLALNMKVIIGKIEDYTPVLKDTLRHIIFNPTWNVPRSIATEEILPKIKKDTSYLERNNYLLLRYSYLGDTIKPDSVNWNEITEDNFPFYIVQKPGSSNALGEVKFNFPNIQSIYLHDTPADHLFHASERDFSHGCIRLEKPLQLARELLKDKEIEKDSIFNIIESDSTIVFYLRNEIPVHFTYLTAFVKNNELHFRNDIYHFDKIKIPMMKPFADRRQSEYWLQELEAEE